MESIKKLARINIADCGFRFSQFEYAYKVPIVKEVSQKCFTGLSLEEIREQYSDEDARNVYFAVTHLGYDPTKIFHRPPEPETYFDIKVVLEENVVFEENVATAYLSSNKRTEANEDRKILSIRQPDGTSVNDFLKNVLGTAISKLRYESGS